ncbi:ribosome-recycling factor, mitochondrial [Colletes gigas]|uniref:ribosome-recycling factor, mitochondrial n=1 Tax=Colletes gigas TaxID=935657 RepID=UPI001C9B55DC|nr:ribosome-recycling factor, mitochondrial [Colletes gigas]
MNLPRLLRHLVLKSNNCSIKYVNTLHDYISPRNILAQYYISNMRFFPYSPSNLGNVNYFSTTHVSLKAKAKNKSQPVHVNLNEVAEVIDVERMLSQFDKVVDQYKEQMIKHVGLRTSIGAIEDLVVKHDGDEYKLQELVEINRKPKLIVINVDTFPQVIPNIVDALSKSQMNLNPQQQGTTLYIPIPKVTRVHRENLAKTAKVYFVKCKDSITDIRNKYVRDVKKKTSLPEDLSFRIEGYISHTSREYVGRAEQLLETKQKELLGESE